MSEVVAGARPPRRRPSAAWVVLAALAAQTAAVVAPLALLRQPPPSGAWALAVIGPLLLLSGLRRRGRAELLAGVPLAWGVAGYVLPEGAFPPALGAAALASAGCYAGAALWWLRPIAGRDAAPAWRALDDAGVLRRAADPLPWVGALLVAGPALGALLWTPLATAVQHGFPTMAGPARVGLALLGTLLGLTFAAALLRGRTARRGHGARAFVFMSAGAACLVLAGLLR